MDIDSYIARYSGCADEKFEGVDELLDYVLSNELENVLARKAIISGNYKLVEFLFNAEQGIDCSREEILDIIATIPEDKLDVIIKTIELYGLGATYEHINKPFCVNYSRLAYGFKDWKIPKSFDEIESPILIKFPGAFICRLGDGYCGELFWIDKQEFESMEKLISKSKKHIIEKDYSSGGHQCDVVFDIKEAFQSCKVVPGTMDQEMKTYVFKTSTYKFWTLLREYADDNFIDDGNPLVARLHEIIESWNKIFYQKDRLFEERYPELFDKFYQNLPKLTDFL